MAGDAATNAASKVRPNEDKLAQIDHAAEDNTWHDTPNLSKDNLKKQFQDVYKGNDPAADASAVAGNAAQTAQTAQGTDTGLDVNAGLNAASQTAQERTGVTPEETEEAKRASKRKAEEYRARTREYLKKKMPQERRDQTVWRLKVSALYKVLRQLQQLLTGL